MNTPYCKEPDNNQIKREENNEQKISEEGVSINQNIDHKSKDGDSCVRTQFGRIIRKPDRLAY